MVLWSTKLRPKFQQLVSAGGQFDFKLLEHVAHNAYSAISKSSNSFASIFEDALLGIIKDLNDVLLAVDQMTDEMEKRKCYRDKQLWYDSLLHRITVAYERCPDGGGWATDQGLTDTKTLNSFGMSTVEANKLEFDANAGTKRVQWE